MTPYVRPLVLLAGAALALSACGSSGGATTGHSRPTTEAASTGAASHAASPVAARDAATVDVCALLTPADANRIARAHGLDGSQTASTTYTMTAKPEPPVTGAYAKASCDFVISDPGGAEAIVTFEVRPSSQFHIYATGQKIPGLGDEAYDGDGSEPVVRVGGLMLVPDQDSVTYDFTLDLLRAMAPRLR